MSQHEHLHFEKFNQMNRRLKIILIILTAQQVFAQQVLYLLLWELMSTLVKISWDKVAGSLSCLPGR